MKKINLCPYKASNCKSCSHKGCNINRKSKRVCIYSNPLKCSLFKEWLKQNKKSKIEHLKHEIEVCEN